MGRPVRTSGPEAIVKVGGSQPTNINKFRYLINTGVDFPLNPSVRTTAGAAVGDLLKRALPLLE
jgi:hypothetical protein